LPNNEQWQRNPRHKYWKIETVYHEDKIEQVGEKGAITITVANNLQRGGTQEVSEKVVLDENSS
jgi:hypothetical protein